MCNRWRLCILKDTTSIMINFEQTPAFAKWLGALKDKTGQARILARLRAAGMGHFADC